MSDPARQAFTPSVYYRNPLAALDWLERAFGFERSLLVMGDDPQTLHAEMSFGGGQVTVGGEWADEIKSPASLGGKTTQTIRVDLEGDVDAHCARARDVGARIWAEPETQFYGARTYRAMDPEGHIWTFSQAIREVSVADMEKASGLTFHTGARS